MKEEIQKLVDLLILGGYDEENAKKLVHDFAALAYSAGFSEGTFVDSSWCKPYTDIHTDIESYIASEED